MSLSIIWKSGDDIVTIPSGSRIGFFGENFGESVPLDNYQGTTVVTNDTGTINSGVLPNVKFINTTQGDWGDGTQNLTLLSSGSATLHIRLTSGSASRLQAVNLYAYSGSFAVGPAGAGSISASAPPDANIMGFEVGGENTTWTYMSGSAAPLALTPHISSAQEDHDYYVAISASPMVTGVNTVISLALYTEWY